jgi:hypothetical protein
MLMLTFWEQASELHQIVYHVSFIFFTGTGAAGLLHLDACGTDPERRVVQELLETHSNTA